MSELKSIPITSIWLRDSGDGYAEVLVEIEGEWHIAIKDYAGIPEDIHFSSMAMVAGMEYWKKWPDEPKKEAEQIRMSI